MTSGGVMPAGNDFNTVCEMAVTWARAVSSFAVGWKKTLTTLMPFMVWLSMCSMSLTVVVNTRSYGQVMFPSNCWAESPVYCQTMLTTGILIFGKMSVGVRRMTTGLMISSSNAA